VFLVTRVLPCLLFVLKTSVLLNEIRALACSNRLFGCGISGLEWLQPIFWGRLQPLICLVARMGSIRLLFGWRTEMGLDPSNFLFGWMDSNRTCIWSPLH